MSIGYVQVQLWRADALGYRAEQAFAAGDANTATLQQKYAAAIISPYQADSRQHYLNLVARSVERGAQATPEQVRTSLSDFSSTVLASDPDNYARRLIYVEAKLAFIQIDPNLAPELEADIAELFRISPARQLNHYLLSQLYYITSSPGS